MNTQKKQKKNVSSCLCGDLCFEILHTKKCVRVCVCVCVCSSENYMSAHTFCYAILRHSLLSLSPKKKKKTKEQKCLPLACYAPCCLLAAVESGLPARPRPRLHHPLTWLARSRSVPLCVCVLVTEAVPLKNTLVHD
jgi:hypothetical protein